MVSSINIVPNNIIPIDVCHPYNNLQITNMMISNTNNYIYTIFQNNTPPGDNYPQIYLGSYDLNTYTESCQKLLKSTSATQYQIMSSELYPTTVSGVDEYLGVFYRSGGAGDDGKIYKIDNSGADVTLVSTLNWGGSTGTSDLQINDGTTITSSNSILTGFSYAEWLGYIDFNNVSNQDSINASVYSWSGADLVADIYPCIEKAGKCYYLTSIASEGQFLFNEDGVTYRDSYQGTPYTIKDRIGYSNNYYVVENGDLYLYYIQSDGTLTYLDTVSANNDYFAGIEFVGNRVYTFDYATTGDWVELRIFNISANTLNEIYNSTIDNYNFTYPIIEYKYPYFYTIAWNESGINGLQLIEFDMPVNFTIGMVKPSITNLDYDSIPAVNEVTSFSFDLNNPEADLGVENSYYKVTCDYSDTTQYYEDFSRANFTTWNNNEGLYLYNGNVSLANIGYVNGYDFGNGLLLDNVSVTFSNDNGLDGVVDYSFDIVGDSYSQFYVEFYDNGLGLIATANIVIDDYQLTITDGYGNTAIKNITTWYNYQHYPIRVFFEFRTTNNPYSYYYVGTNNFYESDSDNIDNIYCDSSYYCYIGLVPLEASSVYTNVFSMKINDLTIENLNNTIIDNVRIKTLDTNPSPYYYTQDTTITDSCTYSSIGAYKTCIFASDELAGTNFLYKDCFDVSVTSLGIGGTNANETAGRPESNLGAMITDITSLALGDSSGTYILVALIIVASMTIGSILMVSKVAGDSNVGAIAGGFTALFSTIFFYYLNWFPLTVMVLIVLISVGTTTYVLKEMMS